MYLHGYYEGDAFELGFFFYPSIGGKSKKYIWCFDFISFQTTTVVLFIYNITYPQCIIGTRIHWFLKDCDIGISGDDAGISHKSRKVHTYLYLCGPQLEVGHNLKINLNHVGDFIILRIYYLPFWIYFGH